MKALDRFARFFTEPSLTRDCTEREINAVGVLREDGELTDSINDAINYPVVNGGSDSELGVSIFPRYVLLNGEPRSYLEFPNHVIVNGTDNR